MNLIAQERNITAFMQIEEISSLVTFFKKSYIIDTIYCIPNDNFEFEVLNNAISKNEVIPIQSWRFEKEEYPSFFGYVNTYFAQFQTLCKKYESKIHSFETLDDLKHELSEARDELIILRDKHSLATRFSVVDNVETFILSNNTRYPISLLLTDYVLNPKTVLDAFIIRSEFFQELIIQISLLLDKINDIVNEKPGIKPIKDTAQYLIYELVFALQESDYFDIPQTEKEKLEESLFSLFNIKRRDKRSKVLGNINNNKSGLKHLKEIIPTKSVTLK